MQLSLDFANVSLWLVAIAIILLINAQLVSAFDGEATLVLDKDRLKKSALVKGLIFLVTVAVRIARAKHNSHVLGHRIPRQHSKVTVPPAKEETWFEQNS